MSEKHDQTRAMLNDENHPPRTRNDDKRQASGKVSYRSEFVIQCKIDFISVPEVVVVHFEIISYSH